MMRMVTGGESSTIIAIENATMVASGYPRNVDLQVRSLVVRGVLCLLCCAWQRAVLR